MDQNRRILRWFAYAALAFLTALSGCMQTCVFVKRMPIAAMPEVIFAVASDFESYPKYFPELHKQVSIVSKVKAGKGVIFENVSSFKGVTARSKWEVTEFEKDKFIRMESELYGTIVILLNQIDYNTTEETMVVVAKIPADYKNEIFGLYENEMKTLKEVCEHLADTAPRQ
jgi:hypothetical protein